MSVARQGPQDEIDNLDQRDKGLLGSTMDGLKEGLGFVGTAASAGMKAVQSTVVNKTMPYYMGFSQMVLLALFPVIWMFCLMPGASGILLHYFMLLFWSKSYIIAWALISNFARWMEYTTFVTDDPDGAHTDYSTAIVMSEAVSQMQMWSPILMFMILFGAMGAVQGVSSQTGSAGNSGVNAAIGAAAKAI